MGFNTSPTESNDKKLWETSISDLVTDEQSKKKKRKAETNSLDVKDEKTLLDKDQAKGNLDENPNKKRVLVNGRLVSLQTKRASHHNGTTVSNNKNATNPTPSPASSFSASPIVFNTKSNHVFGSASTNKGFASFAGLTPLPGAFSTGSSSSSSTEGFGLGADGTNTFRSFGKKGFGFGSTAFPEAQDAIAVAYSTASPTNTDDSPKSRIPSLAASVISLSESHSVQSGEEDEQLVLETECKSYKFDWVTTTSSEPVFGDATATTTTKTTKAWKATGRGDLRVLVDDKDNQIRLVQRQSVTQRLVINEVVRSLERRPNTNIFYVNGVIALKFDTNDTADWLELQIVEGHYLSDKQHGSGSESGEEQVGSKTEDGEKCAHAFSTPDRAQRTSAKRRAETDLARDIGKEKILEDDSADPGANHGVSLGVEKVRVLENRQVERIRVNEPAKSLLTNGDGDGTDATNACEETSQFASLNWDDFIHSDEFKAKTAQPQGRTFSVGLPTKEFGFFQPSLANTKSDQGPERDFDAELMDAKCKSFKLTRTNTSDPTSDEDPATSTTTTIDHTKVWKETGSGLLIASAATCTADHKVRIVQREDSTQRLLIDEAVYSAVRRPNTNVFVVNDAIALKLNDNGAKMFQKFVLNKYFVDKGEEDKEASTVDEHIFKEEDDSYLKDEYENYLADEDDSEL